ncbi:hypothetical protein P4E94_18525 [Pontiellaceae bacterium B12219]|nr:hypothetical protein [Pontiellaceae bacterium B12219]
MDKSDRLLANSCIDYSQYVAMNTSELDYYAFNDTTLLHADLEETPGMVRAEDSYANSEFNNPLTAAQFMTIGTSSHQINMGKQNSEGNALFMFEFRDPSEVLGESFSPVPVSIPDAFHGHLVHPDTGGRFRTAPHLPDISRQTMKQRGGRSYLPPFFISAPSNLHHSTGSGHQHKITIRQSAFVQPPPSLLRKAHSIGKPMHCLRLTHPVWNNTYKPEVYHEISASIIFHWIYIGFILNPNPVLFKRALSSLQPTRSARTWSRDSIICDRRISILHEYLGTEHY